MNDDIIHGCSAFLCRFALNQVKDQMWHQLCMTWSGFNGVVYYYLDGNNVFSGINPTRGEISGGGYLSVGHEWFLLTELNLWDKVLNEQDIAKNAKKCDGGKGNVIQWHQGFDKKYEKLYESPSVCKVPSENTDQNASSQNESVPPPDIESSG